MVTGERPGDFDFSVYRESLLYSPLPESLPTNWSPADTEYLGRTHYQVCWERLRDRYRGTLSGNDIRRQYGLHLCRQIDHERLAESVQLRRKERKFDESTSVEDGLLCAMESFISMLAKECRRDVYTPGALEEYRYKLRRILPQESCSLTDVLTLVLQLGADLFGFYLLLWEVVLAGVSNLEEQSIHA